MLVRSVGLLRDARFGGQVRVRDRITDGEGQELRQRTLLLMRVAEEIREREREARSVTRHATLGDLAAVAPHGRADLLAVGPLAGRCDRLVGLLAPVGQCPVGPS